MFSPTGEMVKSLHEQQAVRENIDAQREKQSKESTFVQSFLSYANLVAVQYGGGGGPRVGKYNFWNNRYTSHVAPIGSTEEETPLGVTIDVYKNELVHSRARRGREPASSKVSAAEVSIGALIRRANFAPSLIEPMKVLQVYSEPTNVYFGMPGEAITQIEPETEKWDEMVRFYAILEDKKSILNGNNPT